MSDSDDVVIVEECPPSTSKNAKFTPSKGRPSTQSSPWSTPRASQSQTASSVLLTTWLGAARRETASTQRMDARRKAAGVRSPAKRPKIERKSGDRATDTITIDDDDEIESDKKEDKVEEEKSAKVSPANSQVTGSLVTAVASVLRPKSPNKKVSPANSQASQGSKSAVSSICDAETQENNESLSQEARAAFVREMLRVDYDDVRETARSNMRDGEVVRNRGDRAAMHGQDCPCCSEYYDNLGMDDADRKRRIDQVSRHRYVARPMPRTPPHYWDMDFPTEEEQEARGMITRRVERRVDQSEEKKEEKIKDQPEKKEEEIKDQPEKNGEEVYVIS